MIVVAVPVKELDHAKQRLRRVLTPAQRADLARAMLRDVLRALGLARVDEVWVVTRDAEVAAIASSSGSRLLTEDADRGHTAAVRHAQHAAARAAARVFVTVPGDVPCIGPDEVDALVEAVGTGPAAAFTPSRAGAGTNGVALTPPDLLPLRFGEPSFQDHLAAARRAGLVPRVLPLPGLGLDVDDAEDLRVLLRDGTATESGRLLRSWSIDSRLEALVRASV